tara:strand:+ start:229 stop:1254 length:1026 start_codon:yes stop_codon:yes gene_type:complete
MESNCPLGALMLDIEGPELTAEDRQLLARPVVGGLILFTRNYRDSRQLRDLVADARNCNPELLIAVDQEGGRVQRFRHEFEQLPPLHSLFTVYQEDPDRALELARSCAWVMAAEILHHGIDLSFAPVLDLYTDISAVIGNRAFAADVKTATDLARAYISGMHEAGMIATGKHFPGHGSVAADSHHELPVDIRDSEEIFGTDMQVFSHCIDVLDAIMPAHVSYPSIDSECAGFSSKWLQQILRQQLGFAGVIFSDDLGMQAARESGSPADRAAKALSAGCDMVLSCNDREAALAIADYLDANHSAGNYRLSKLRATPAADISELYKTERWQAATDQIAALVS